MEGPGARQSVGRIEIVIAHDRHDQANENRHQDDHFENDESFSEIIEKVKHVKHKQRHAQAFPERKCRVDVYEEAGYQRCYGKYDVHLIFRLFVCPPAKFRCFATRLPLRKTPLQNSDFF